MWKNGKQSASAGDHSTILQAARDINVINNSAELVDQEVEKEVEKLRKSRFFVEFDQLRSSIALGGRLSEGNLSSGSLSLRERGYAWCARLLSRKRLDQAQEFLNFAQSLGDSSETKIAEAFILSQKKDKAAAFQALSILDSDASRSAGLMIVAYHDGAEGAMKWMSAAGYSVDDLDSDGKSFLLSQQLWLGDWAQAASTVGSFAEMDFDETPILHHFSALTHLTLAIPADFRAVVLSQVPFELADFSLASDEVGMDARRFAHEHFLKAVEAANRLGCQRAARVADEYVLWLELRDPAQFVKGQSRLVSKLRDRKTSVGFIHYALQFGVKLDLDLVERDIDKHIAINGGMTMDAAIARFAIALTKPTPEEAANYIARHHNQLADHIEPKLMQFRQIEMYSRAGLPDKANQILDQLTGEGISSDEERNLRRIIAEAEGNDPIESRKAQYKTTGALEDLINLVVELEEQKHWEDLCVFGRELFEATRSLKDAERLVNALSNTQRSEALVSFLKENDEMLKQSSILRMFYAWGLYHEGAFSESSAALAELSEQAGSQNYRALQVNLGIASGDWASLTSFIYEEYQNRNHRSAQDLIGAAQLALHLGLPYAKELLFEAAAKAEEDSSVLAAAYFIATTAGWEDNSQVLQWLEKAAKLSGESGPLQRMSLKDILDRKPEWDRRESETWRLLSQCQIPIFLAAESLNRTLIDLIIFPALANLSKKDPRRRNAIPAYSGKRMHWELDVRAKSVALDATALLNLSFLKILDTALDVFENVFIPHSTFGWLFEERQKATFHQPSRIVNARKIRDLMATDLLEKFTPRTVASEALSAQIGDELAAMITEAEKMQDGDESQHVVVRSAPVHRLSSLMEEEADLTSHAPVLSSCLAVVEKLRRKGQITADEERRARAYLQLHEKPWPNQPDITDGATLYLDDLSITYLLHLGILGKLKAAGFRAVASPRLVSESDALISYELISQEVMDVIEGIRSSLSSRIKSGKVKVSRSRKFDEQEEKSFHEHPSVGIIALAAECDVAIIDDRFLNRHANIDNGDAQAPVFTTLELLDAFVAVDVLSENARLELRTRLRQAGYFFVPINEVELERCLMESNVDEGVVVETAELKAIRESVLNVRMTNWLLLPEEAPWLDGTLKAFVHVLKNLWVDDAVIEDVTARSNWLLKQYDVRGWAHRLVPDNADNLVRVGRAAHILMLLTPPQAVARTVVEAYWNWVQDSVLAPIEEQFPELYKWLVDWHRSQIAEIIETRISEGGHS